MSSIRTDYDAVGADAHIRPAVKTTFFALVFGEFVTPYCRDDVGSDLTVVLRAANSKVQ